MTSNTSIVNLFKSIDTKNLPDFLGHLSPSCVFRFGNLEPVAGLEAIGTFVGYFFDSIDSLRHEVLEAWPVEGGVVCHGWVTYGRKDGTSLSVPFANVMKGGDAEIDEYLIFADTSRLYAP